MFLPSLNSCNVAIIGMGYVGLPLAIQCGSINIFQGKKNPSRNIIGFDINKKRIINLRKGIDDNKTFKKFELSDNKFEEDPSKINYNLRYFYLISIFILTFILAYILINIKKIILIIKKL